MKILVISQYYKPEPFRIDEICEELVKRGHEVTVVTSLPNYPDGYLYEGYTPKRRLDIINGVNIIRCNVRPRKKGYVNLFLNYISYLIKATKELQFLPGEYDCIYVYQLSPITSVHPAILYGKRHKRPVFLYCLDLWPESIVNETSECSWIFKLVKKYSRYIYNNVSSIAVTSPSFIKYLSSLTRFSEGVIKYIPQHSQDILESEKTINNKWEHETVNIMFLGNIGESQNVHLLLKATKVITTDIPYKVHIVGSGSYFTEIERMVSELKLSDKVILHGRQPKSKMPYYYSIADICYLSLRDEGVVSWTIPGKLQEYMSAGKPVVAAIKGDSKYVIEEASCGIVVGNEDINGLASALKKMIENLDLRLKCGRNARLYYESHFSLHRHITQLEKSLNDMLHSNDYNI